MNYTKQTNVSKETLRKRLGLKSRKMLAERPQYWLYSKSHMLERIELIYSKPHISIWGGSIAMLLAMILSCY